MSEGAYEAMQQYDAELSEALITEARKSREKFIETVIQKLSFALQKNREEYMRMEVAYEEGSRKYEFKYYAVTADWDEKRIRQGDKYVPAVLFLMKSMHDDIQDSQDNRTLEMILALPTQQDFELRDDTTIEDLVMPDSVFVFWKTTNGEQGCHEVTAEGLFKSQIEDVEASFTSMLDHIDIHDFGRLHTSAPLVARFREDIVNLELAPYSSSMLELSSDV